VPREVAVFGELLESQGGAACVASASSSSQQYVQQNHRELFMKRKKRPFSSAEWKKINRRRLNLIYKKYGGEGLALEEEKELKALQAKAERYLESFEGPSVKYALRQVRKLKWEARLAIASLKKVKLRVFPRRNRILVLMDKEQSSGLSRGEKTELARLQRQGVAWTMLEVERHPPTPTELKRMKRKAKEFTRKLLGKT
jgi:hypothetical protein